MCFPWSCCSLQWYFSYNILCWISAFKLQGKPVIMWCAAKLIFNPTYECKKIEKPKFYFQLHPGKSTDKQVQKYMRAKGCFIYSEFISKLIQDCIGGEIWKRPQQKVSFPSVWGKIRIFSCFLAGIMAKPKFLHWLHDAPIPLKLPSDGGWIYFMEPLKFCKGFTVFLPFCHSQMPTFALKLQIWDAFLYIKAR